MHGDSNIDGFLNGKFDAEVLTYERYKVTEEFEVKSGIVAPWFEKKGLGRQYYTDFKVRDIEENFKRPMLRIFLI